MFSSVSGLGRLFNSASASSSSQSTRARRHYDSIAEETVTYDLLYPELESLYEDQHHAFPVHQDDPKSVAAAAKSTDDRGGLHVQASRDVRILVAQKIYDMNRVLFDSHLRDIPSSSRTTSPTSPSEKGELKENTLTAGFGGSERSPKARTAPHSRQTSFSQTAQSIFSSSVSPLPSTSEQGSIFSSSRTPTLTRPVTSESESGQTRIAREEKEELDDMLNCMFGSSGLLTTSSTKIHVKTPTPQSRSLSRPLSPETSRPYSPRDYEAHRARPTRANTAETLPIRPTNSSPTKPQAAQRRSGSYVLITKLLSIDVRNNDLDQPHRQQENGCAAKEGGRSRRTSVPKGTGSTKHLRTPTFAVAIVIYIPEGSQLAGLKTSHQSATFDFGFTASQPGTPDHHRTSFQPPGDQRNPTSLVMDRWSILTRTLTSLEALVRASLKDLLVSQSMSATNPRRALQVEPHALCNLPGINEAAESSAKRVALALRTRPAITGQDRWVIWKGVLRGIDKGTGATNPHHFLHILMTAFLGIHKGWLDLLAPRWYRRQHSKQDGYHNEEADAIRFRTVVVSPDKMAARRLIFLLSSFLSANHAVGLLQAQRTPDAPLLSQQDRIKSLQDSPRRLAKTRTPTLLTQVPDSEAVTDYGSWSKPSHVRRTSDTLSIRSLALPIAPSGTRKSSVTTTATILPSPQHAIPLFSNLTPEKGIGTAADPRPGSSGSLALLSLQRTLSRSDSNDRSNTSSDSRGNRVDSDHSNYWPSRRGSSTETSEDVASSGEGLGISIGNQTKSGSNPVKRLSKMVEEAASLSLKPQDADVETAEDEPNGALPTTTHKPSPPKSIPRSSPPEPFPLILSVDEKDGIIDVQYSPTTSYTSIPSALASPRGTHTTPGSYEILTTFPNLTPSFSHAPHPIPSSTTPTAGYLPTYHPDFALQAVRPSPALKTQIKHSMRTEPPLSPDSDTNGWTNGWTNVCSTVLVHPQSSTATLLTLRRKNASSPHHQVAALLNRPADPAEEHFTEQKVQDFDPALAEAIDRVVSHHGSHSSSRTPSRPPSRGEVPGNAHVGIGIGGKKGDETKRIVFEALKNVAREIAAEVEKEEKVDLKQENVLREGVRDWLREVKIRAG